MCHQPLGENLRIVGDIFFCKNALFRLRHNLLMEMFLKGKARILGEIDLMDPKRDIRQIPNWSYYLCLASESPKDNPML